MKDNNITVGCNPPANDRYCPEDNVTRGEMATFLKRFAENTVADAATLQGLDPTDLAPVSIVGGVDALSTGPIGSFANIPGAYTTITVPPGQTALVIARFTAESSCTTGGASNYGSVRLVLNGSEMAPVAGTDFAFDTSESEPGDSRESHAVERFEMGVAPGTHTVVAQWQTDCSALEIDDWTLVAEARPGRTAALAGD